MLYLWTLWGAHSGDHPLRRQEGQGLVEYALIIVLVAIMLVAALGLLGGQLVASYISIRDSLIAPG